MRAKKDSSPIPFPKSWPLHVKSAVLHAISLAHYAIVHARGRAMDSIYSRVRLGAQIDRLRDERSLLREETRIKDLRMAQIPPQKT